MYAAANYQQSLSSFIRVYKGLQETGFGDVVTSPGAPAVAVISCRPILPSADRWPGPGSSPNGKRFRAGKSARPKQKAPIPATGIAALHPVGSKRAIETTGPGYWFFLVLLKADAA